MPGAQEKEVVILLRVRSDIRTGPCSLNRSWLEPVCGEEALDGGKNLSKHMMEGGGDTKPQVLER